MTYRKLRYTDEVSRLAWEELGENERKLLEKAVERASASDLPGAKRALRDYAVTRLRARRKARNDAETDNRTRVLIGARLTREKGMEVKVCALATGRSVYRFVADAIERETARCMNMQNNE